MSIIYGVLEARKGMNAGQIAASMAHMPLGSWLSIASMISGVLMSMLAGYVCARMSRRTDYRLGFILSAISVTAGLLLGWSMYSLPMHALLAGLATGAILFGTRLGAARNAAGDLGKGYIA